MPGSSGAGSGAAVVAYASEVKFDLLDVPEGPVVSEDGGRGDGRRRPRVLGADVGLAVTGVAGPAEQDGPAARHRVLGLAVDDDVEAVHAHLPGDRERVRQFATISLLDLLRQRLLER